MSSLPLSKISNSNWIFYPLVVTSSLAVTAISMILPAMAPAHFSGLANRIFDLAEQHQVNGTAAVVLVTLLTFGPLAFIAGRLIMTTLTKPAAEKQLQAAYILAAILSLSWMDVVSENMNGWTADEVRVIAVLGMLGLINGLMLLKKKRPLNPDKNQLSVAI